jgi:acyl dehydratase
VSDSRRQWGYARGLTVPGGVRLRGQPHLVYGNEVFSNVTHVTKPEPQLAWEDFHPGRVFLHGPRRLPREEMISFAAEFDPQPMHLDEAAAAATMMGGLSASGWYVCCILMRMCTDAFVLNSTSMGAPGVDEVKWLKPIRPDDQLTLRATVLDTRASNSRPEMGFVRFNFELFNAAGDRVMVLTTSLMLGRRKA